MHIKKIATITRNYATCGLNRVRPKQKRSRNVKAAAFWMSSRLVVIYEPFSYVRAYFSAVRHMVTFPYFPLVVCAE